MASVHIAAQPAERQRAHLNRRQFRRTLASLTFDNSNRMVGRLGAMDSLRRAVEGAA